MDSPLSAQPPVQVRVMAIFIAIPGGAAIAILCCMAAASIWSGHKRPELFGEVLRYSCTDEPECDLCGWPA